MQTLTRIVGGVLWIIAALLPLCGQMIYAIGPDWTRQTTVEGHVVLGLGVVGTLVAFGVLLFMAGMACFASASEGR